MLKIVFHFKPVIRYFTIGIFKVPIQLLRHSDNLFVTLNLFFYGTYLLCRFSRVTKCLKTNMYLIKEYLCFLDWKSARASPPDEH